MRLAGLDTSQIAVLAVIVITVVLLLGSTRRRLRRSRTENTPTIREQYGQLSAPSAVTRDVEAVMVELDELSRQVHGRLDAKIAKLEALLRQADERIDQLSRQCRASAGQPTLDVTLGCEQPDATDTGVVAMAPQAPTDDIYRLADSGGSALEIAQKVGRPVGEIELMLSLRKTRSRNEARPPAATSSLILK